MKIISTFLLLIIFSASLLIGQNLYEEKTFSTSEGKTFTLEAVTGGVKVNTWNKNEVNIKVFADEDAIERLDFNYEESSNGIKYTSKKKDWLKNLVNIKVNYEITTPKNYNLNLATSGGSISVNNLKGNLKGSTAGGSFDINDVSGNIKLSTSGGKINLEDVNGLINVASSGGNIEVLGTKNSEINITTSGGSINIEAENSEVIAKTSGGSINLNYSGTNKGINLVTSGGSINLTLPESTNGDLNLTTSGGSVKSDFVLNNVDRKSSTKIVAKLGSGGEEIKATCSGGSINLNSK